MGFRLACAYLALLIAWREKESYRLSYSSVVHVRRSRLHNQPHNHAALYSALADAAPGTQGWTVSKYSFSSGLHVSQDANLR
jgi:hypothetical protein